MRELRLAPEQRPGSIPALVLRLCAKKSPPLPIVTLLLLVFSGLARLFFFTPRSKSSGCRRPPGALAQSK